MIADRRGEPGVLRRFDEILTHVLDLADVHERHAGRYHASPERFDVASYESELKAARSAIAGLFEHARV